MNKSEVTLENKRVSLDFESLDYLLIVASTPFSPSYLHGMLSGLLCVTEKEPALSWKRFYQAIGCLQDPQSAIYKSFEKLFICTAMELKDLESNLILILPNDEQPLAQRLEALADWCEGFIDGIKLTEKDLQTLLQNATVKEVLSDFVEIKEVSSAALETDSNENNYMQLVEFVRVGALLIHAECVETWMKTSENYSKEIH